MAKPHCGHCPVLLTAISRRNMRRSQRRHRALMGVTAMFTVPLECGGRRSCSIWCEAWPPAAPLKWVDHTFHRFRRCDRPSATVRPESRPWLLCSYGVPPSRCRPVPDFAAAVLRGSGEPFRGRFSIGQA